MKLKDIVTHLEKTVSLKHLYNRIVLSIQQLERYFLVDLVRGKKDIDISSERHVRLYKNAQRVFDSAIKGKGKDIVLKKLRLPFLTPSTHSFRKQGMKVVKKHKKNKKVFTFQYIPKNYILRSAVFLLLFLFVLFLDKLFVVYLVESSYKHLQSISSETQDTEHTLEKSYTRLIIADILFKPFLVFSHPDVINGYAAIQAGKSLVQGGETLYNLGVQTKTYIEQKGFENIRYSLLFENILPYLQEVDEKLKASLQSIEAIQIDKENINFSVFQERKEQLSEISHLFSYILQNKDPILHMLGDETRRKYLVVFQNNDEIRPTGGFMGSMAMIEVFQGHIDSIETKDVYAYEWNLKKSLSEKIKAPKGIDQITDTWGLRDANYFLTLKENSKSIKFFVEKAGYPIDGIIYLNKSTVESLLRIIGPVEVSGIEEAFTHENFARNMSLLVETKQTKSATLDSPKDILFTFMEEFMTQLQESSLTEVGKEILREFKNGEIQIYMFNIWENEVLKSLHLQSEPTYNDSLDFDYPVYTSIGGNKSDRYITRSYKKYIQTRETCDIDTTLTIEQTHTFNKTEEEKVQNILKSLGREDIGTQIDIQGKGDNKSYVRVILPPKIKLADLGKDMTIARYDTYTLVDFFITTEPTQTTSTSIQYTLPNPGCTPYSYTHYKQPGLDEYTIDIFPGEEKSIHQTGIQTNYYYNQGTYK